MANTDSNKWTFRFKQFDCCHERSAMKIGVDSVLLGAWADVCDAKRILDVGSGCGLLALMCAQRNANADIVGVEINPDAAAEMSDNFVSSPWSDRLAGINEDIRIYVVSALEQGSQFDFIICNPPYFDSGVDETESSRMTARHQGSLSPYSLLGISSLLLTEGGKVSMILPSMYADDVVSYASMQGLGLVRRQDVQGTPSSEIKRTLLEFGKGDSQYSPEADGGSRLPVLILNDADGRPTAENRALCSAFYTSPIWGD